MTIDPVRIQDTFLYFSTNTSLNFRFRSLNIDETFLILPKSSLSFVLYTSIQMLSFSRGASFKRILKFVFFRAAFLLIPFFSFYNIVST